MNRTYAEIVTSTVARSTVRYRLQSHPAVVLERIARGAGAVRWFYLSKPEELDDLAAIIQPASIVSFYFDDRLKVEPATESALADIIEAVKTGEVVIGTVKDQLTIDVELASTSEEVLEAWAAIPPATRVMHGTFPARDNDGVASITISMPDADGTVRSHPH